MQQQLGRTDSGPPTDDSSFDRRRGPRRLDEDETPLERRHGDRRTHLPGLDGLLEDVVSETPPAPDPSASAGDAAGTDYSAPGFDRRRGPRRDGSVDPGVPVERRGPDRRRRKPGLSGLFGAILGLRSGAPRDEA